MPSYQAGCNADSEFASSIKSAEEPPKTGKVTRCRQHGGRTAQTTRLDPAAQAPGPYLATRRRTALASRHSEPHSEPNRGRRLQSRLQRAVPHPRWQGLLWQGLLPANRERRARIAALFYAATRSALCPTGRCLPRVRRARLSRVRLAHCHPHGHARTTACPFQPRRSVAFCGLSKLSVWWMVWWIKLGIAHQRIEPGQPQQNGRHERIEHKTLKRETARPPQSDHTTQQVRFDTCLTPGAPSSTLSGPTLSGPTKPWK